MGRASSRNRAMGVLKKGLEKLGRLSCGWLGFVALAGNFTSRRLELVSAILQSPEGTNHY
jgi:hypothetical protein